MTREESLPGGIMRCGRPLGEVAMARAAFEQIGSVTCWTLSGGVARPNFFTAFSNVSACGKPWRGD